MAQEAIAVDTTSNLHASAAPDDREALEALRRKLRFRAWHRGTCEADTLIGGFADQCLTQLTCVELHQFERLLDEDDPLIDDWIFGRQYLPRRHDNAVMAWLRGFCRAYSTRPCAIRGAKTPRDQHHDGAAPIVELFRRAR
jgi:antitoxin CptB